jgi:hypothetical protein
VNGATVDLLSPSSLAIAASTITLPNGSYQLSVPVVTVGDALTDYVIRATLPGGTGAPTGTQIFYKNGATPSSPTQSFQGDHGSPMTWRDGTAEDIYYLVPPAWADSTIGNLQVGAALTDGVSAVGGSTIGYSITAGALPAGLALSPSTGALTGTPTTVALYDFTVTATNLGGHIDQQLSGLIYPAATLEIDPLFAAGTDLSSATLFIGGSGLTPLSAYDLTLHSTPVVITSGSTGGAGAFSGTFALPASTPPGAHSLVLTAVALSGTTITTTVWFSVLANGTIGAVSLTGPVPDVSSAPTGLASTGADPTALIHWGVLALLLGAVLLSLRRRQLI